MLIDLPDEYIAQMRKLASREAPYDDDDFDLLGACGGNFDDAYAIGETAGEITAAREIVSYFPDKT